MLEFEKQKKKHEFEKKYISLGKILEFEKIHKFEKNAWIKENLQI